ncbi:hypothetical protein [Luteipulveratus halotolerans]|nr:hypothetical protein [Luteipulveratus halotolerans]
MPATFQDGKTGERLNRLFHTVVIESATKGVETLSPNRLAAEMADRGYAYGGSTLRKVRNGDHDPPGRALLGICITVSELTGIEVTPDYFFVAETATRVESELDARKRAIEERLRGRDLTPPGDG